MNATSTTATTDTTFPVLVTGEYTVNEVPPRCRKPRDVSYDTTVTVEVPIISAKDAPVAFRVTPAWGAPRTTDIIRLWNGNLYGLYLPYSRQTDPTIPGTVQFPSETQSRAYFEGKEAFVKATCDEYASFVIIDGEVWAMTGEPRYYTVTMGLGDNHGGTSFGEVDRDNSNIRAEAYFRADDFDAALAYAVDVATRRGDTRSAAEFVDSPESHRTIEVLIPEAVTLVTVDATPQNVRDLRWEYLTAIGRLDRVTSDPELEPKLFAEVVRIRGEIIAAGFAPVEPQIRPYERRTR